MLVHHVNASTATTVSEAALGPALRDGEAPPCLVHHVRAVLDEADPAALMDLVLEGVSTYARLADRLLPPGHGNRTWLDERRSSSLRCPRRLPL